MAGANRAHLVITRPCIAPCEGWDVVIQGHGLARRPRVGASQLGGSGMADTSGLFLEYSIYIGTKCKWTRDGPATGPRFSRAFGAESDPD